MLRVGVLLGVVGLVVGCVLLSGLVSDAVAGGLPVAIDDDGSGFITAPATRYSCSLLSCTKEDGSVVNISFCYTGGDSPSCSGSLGPNCTYTCTISGGAAK